MLAFRIRSFAPKHTRMKLFRSLVLFFALLVMFVSASSWGYLMHRTTTQLSVYQLPAEMQPLFFQNLEDIVRNSIRPDQRRNTDKTEDVKHFIDLEGYGTDAVNKMPLTWSEAVARYSQDSLLKYGYVPYWVVEMKSRLTSAFRAGKRDSILFYATDLAHYIEDAHVPLHTTLNYDGQLTNQKGLHSLWESTVPELFIADLNLKGKKKAKYIKNPAKEIWKTVRRSYSLVPDVLRIERELSAGFSDSAKYRYQNRNGREVRSYSTAFARAYGLRIQKTVNDQALRAADLVADFWYTAWVDAGKPDLSKLLTKSWQAADDEQVKKETAAYRQNSLLKNGWLLSKKDADKNAE